MKRTRRTASLVAAAILASALPQAPVTASAEALTNPKTGLPYAFDLREQGLVSAVKNQDPYGTCWAHGAMGMLESRIIADDPGIDLSEWHLALFNMMGEPGGTDSSDPDLILNYGGSPENTAAMLLNRVGPMREADYPYCGDIPDRTTPIGQMQKEACLEVTAFHQYESWADNVFQPEPLEIKKVLFGGVSTTVTVSQCLFMTDCYDPVQCSLYYPADQADAIAAQISADSQTTPHMMTLVGWDDNYSRENFTYPPDRDGAWLVKNSWGTDWGDAGYVWISYADTTASGFTWYDVRPASDHDLLFSHDNHGDSGMLALSTDGDDTEAYYANVFVPETDCCLTDLMLCCTDPDDTLTVTVYTALTDPNDPSSGTPAPSAVYQELQKGYQEVPLAEHVSVKAGEPFAVTVRASGDPGQHIPCELSMEDYKLVTNKEGFCSGNFNATGLSADQLRKYFGRQESFVSKDGKVWTDTADVTKITNAGNYYLILGNVCVRAYGVNAGRVLFSQAQDALAAGTEIALSSAEGADIYFAVDGGAYQKYTEPLTFTGDMTVSAYADTGSKAVQTRHFTQRHAVLSSLLMKGDNGCQYADLSGNSFKLTMQTGSFIQPISTGQITVNGTPVISGHKYTVQPEDAETSILLRVEQAGMLPTEYRITVKEMKHIAIPNGIYYNAADKTACEFRNGTGTEKHLADGTETTFTYAQTGTDEWVFSYPERTVRYTTGMFLNSDRGCLTGYIDFYADDDSYLSYEYLNPLSFAAYPAYTDAQIEQYVLKTYQSYRGKAPTSVKMDETPFGVIILDFYDGSTLIERLFSDRFGLMYTPDMKPMYYALPQYRICDLNGDKVISIADAVMMMRMIAEEAPEQLPRPAILDAADLDRDGVLTVRDAALLLDMINRMTNDHA